MIPSFTRGLLIVITCGLICKAIGAFILPAVKPAPPRSTVVHVVAVPKTVSLAWDAPDVQLAIVRRTNLVSSSWVVLQTWPANWPTNFTDTNPPAGAAFYTIGYVGSNSATLYVLLTSNQWQYATTN